MSNFYLAEAFKKLSLLEDDFSFDSDAGKLDELREFVADDIEAPEEEVIIDTEAETEDDIQDNYIGKVILECDCCHTRIYKNEDDVIIDSESELANVDEVCPVCGGEFGYHVIGKIEAFDSNKDIEAEADAIEAEDDIDTDDEFSDEEIGEAFNDIKNEKREYFEHSNLEESKKLREGNGFDIIKRFKDLDDGRTHVIARNPNRAEDDFLGAYAVGLGYDDKYGSWGQGVYDFKTPDEAEKWLKGPNHYRKAGYKVSDESLTEANKNLGVADKIAVKDDKSLEDDQEELVHAPEEKIEAINEDVTIDMSNRTVVADYDNVEVDMNSGKVELGDDANNTDEMIAPLDAETQAEIEANAPEEPVDDLGLEDPVAMEDEPVDDLSGEEPIEGEEGDAGLEEIEPTEGPEAEDETDEEDDLDIDDFDNEGFDYLGESYLKKVYENVASYKTNSAKMIDKNLVVEGKIVFESKKEIPTTFVFESKKETKRGKTMLEGHNNMFSSANKSFILRGSLQDKKFVCENLVYNYTTKTLNESNEEELVRVYGRSKKK